MERYERRIATSDKTAFARSAFCAEPEPVVAVFIVSHSRYFAADSAAMAPGGTGEIVNQVRNSWSLNVVSRPRASSKSPIAFVLLLPCAEPRRLGGSGNGECIIVLLFDNASKRAASLVSTVVKRYSLG